LVGEGLIFARTDVIDQKTGIVYFTGWVKSDKSQWLHWTPQPDQSWPDKVTVILTLTADDPTAPGSVTDSISSLFIANSSDLTEVILKQYAQFARFLENPVRFGADKSGRFYYFLNYPSDIQIQIYRSEPGSLPLHEINDQNVPSGSNSAQWNFDGQRLQPGDYSAFFRLTSRDPRGVQPNYVVLVHVK
jgi:hypothetical protein